MADTFLVVTTSDVLQTAQDAVTVTASFDGGAEQPLAKVDLGRAELKIPPGTTLVQVRVTPPAPFWPCDQKLVVNLTSTPPSMKFDSTDGQKLNSRALPQTTSRGVDSNLELPMTLCHFIDATNEVVTTAAGLSPPVSFPTTPLAVTRFNTPILNPPTSTQMLSVTSKSVPFLGQIFFAKRQMTPEIVVFAHPGWNNPSTPSQARLPIPFHVFYHPQIPNNFGDDYPEGRTYLDLVFRYMFGSALPVPSVGKQLIAQNNAEILKNILVFPIGDKLSYMGDAANPIGLRRMLKEALFFVQRMRGITMPIAPLGRLSLSGFSRGSAAIQGALGSPPFDASVRNVFVLDGRFNNAPPDGSVDVSATKAFCKLVAKDWFLDGAGSGKSLRMYTKIGLWFDEFRSHLQLPITATGAAGSRECESDHATLLHVPDAFWSRFVPGIKSSQSHQLMPAFFLEHAVTNSDFVP